MSANLKVDYEAMSDLQLAAKIAARIPAAASLLIQRNNQRLFRVASVIVKSRHEAEDVVQSTYLNAFRAIAAFDGRSSLSTWLTRIAINEALGRVRAAKRRRGFLDENSVTTIDAYRDKLMRGSAPPAAADAEMARKELRAMLETAINELPDDFRTVFVLREIEGLSVEEVALALEIPAATVKTRAFRARRQLRQTLDPDIRGALTGTFPFGGAHCAAMTARVLKLFETINSTQERTFSDD